MKWLHFDNDSLTQWVGACRVSIFSICIHIYICRRIYSPFNSKQAYSTRLNKLSSSPPLFHLLSMAVLLYVVLVNSLCLNTLFSTGPPLWPFICLPTFRSAYLPVHALVYVYGSSVSHHGSVAAHGFFHPHFRPHFRLVYPRYLPVFSLAGHYVCFSNRSFASPVHPLRRCTVVVFFSSL